MHPDGSFIGEITDHGISQTKSGNDQAFVVLKSEHGQITAYLSLSQNAIKWSAKKLRACGCDRIGDVEDGQSLVGNSVRFEVEHEEDLNGKVRARVGWINRPDEGPALKRSAASEASARRFADAMAALNEDAADEDVPF